MSGSTQCPHTDVHFHLNQAIASDTPLRYLEVKGVCKICDSPMCFRCDVVGSQSSRPAMSVDAEEMRLPFLFGDEKPTGNERGFNVSVRGGGDA